MYMVKLRWQKYVDSQNSAHLAAGLKYQVFQGGMR